MPLPPTGAELVPLIDLHGPPERLLRKRGSNFATLAKAIVFQVTAHCMLDGGIMCQRGIVHGER